MIFNQGNGVVRAGPAKLYPQQDDDNLDGVKFGGSAGPVHPFQTAAPQQPAAQPNLGPYAPTVANAQRLQTAGPAPTPFGPPPSGVSYSDQAFYDRMNNMRQGRHMAAARLNEQNGRTDLADYNKSQAGMLTSGQVAMNQQAVAQGQTQTDFMRNALPLMLGGMANGVQAGRLSNQRYGSETPFVTQQSQNAATAGQIANRGAATMQPIQIGAAQEQLSQDQAVGKYLPQMLGLKVDQGRADIQSTLAGAGQAKDLRAQNTALQGQMRQILHPFIQQAAQNQMPGDPGATPATPAPQQAAAAPTPPITQPGAFAPMGSPGMSAPPPPKANQQAMAQGGMKQEGDGTFSNPSYPGVKYRRVNGGYQRI